MYKIVLINMPFIMVDHSALALMKLKSVLDRRFKHYVSVEILYLNHDFAHYIGLESYSAFARNVQFFFLSGFGDWFFRQSAFPALQDNTEEYFLHYFTTNKDQDKDIRQMVRSKRPGINNFLDELIREYKLDEADIVGFTSIAQQNVASFAMAKRVKEKNLSVVTVIGGPNCEYPIGETFVKNIEQIDFVFSGPALISFPELVQHCLNGEMDKCHEIDGVFSKKNCVLSSLNSDTRMTKCSEKVPCVKAYGEDLDINTKLELDYESFLDTFETAFPNGEASPVILFETSRGCWWAQKNGPCLYCGLSGINMGYQEMIPENAITQFKTLFKYSDRCQLYGGVDNAIPKCYTKEVFPYINTPANVAIFYEVKVDLIEEDLEALSKANVKYVQPGLESLATSTLKLMKKGTTAFNNIRFLKNCVTYRVGPIWAILVGTPGEKEEVYEEYLRLIPLLYHLPPPPHVAAPIVFTRFSPYVTHAQEYGLDLKPTVFYQLTYPFKEETLKHLALFFDDQNRNAEYAIARNNWIDKITEMVKKWQIRWWGRMKISESDGKDRPLPPKLIFKEKGNSTVVYDSRSGQAVEHESDDVDIQILDYLEKPRRIIDVGNALGHIPNLHPKERIERMQSLGLLFQEGDRFMSLVVSNWVNPRKDKIGIKPREWQDMTTSEFMSFLIAHDVNLWVDEGILRYNAGPDIMTAELCQELKSRKSEIIMLLQDIEVR